MMVSVVSSNPTGGNFIFFKMCTSMLILYKNDRNVRFVLFTKTSNDFVTEWTALISMKVFHTRNSFVFVVLCERTFRKLVNSDLEFRNYFQKKNQNSVHNIDLALNLLKKFVTFASLSCEWAVKPKFLADTFRAITVHMVPIRYYF